MVTPLKNGANINWCNYNPKEESRRCGIKSGKKNSKPILVYDNNMNFVGKYESIAYIEKYGEELLGVKLNRLGLTRSCNKLKQYKGYMFIREIDSVALKNNMV